MRQAVVCHHSEALRKRFGSLTTVWKPYMHDTRGGKVAPVDGQQRKGEVLLWASLRKGLSGAHAAAFLKKGSARGQRSCA